ncbi:hypothetical protein C9I99_05885 [Photobacterium lutimaris]|uniref:Glycoamylase-like domain-containing protein n=1 Tax=Photobacterium lutimaris TaxID=388278 RepID=A0A2T3J0Q4_9GAMM|nr:hypothetical protein C9I99_05885 [Photobacterium lutimaris]
MTIETILFTEGEVAVIHKKKVLAFVLGTFMLGGCVSTSVEDTAINSQLITEVYIGEHHYPENFVQQLHTNLQYFQDGVGVDPQSGMPFDFIRVMDNGDIEPRPAVNSTTVGLYLNVLTEMERAGSNEARKRIGEVLTQLENAPKWNGLFIWMYKLSEGELALDSRSVASAVDAANLISSLAAVSGAYWQHDDPVLAQLSQRADALINQSKEGWYGLYERDTGTRDLLRAAWQDTGDGQPGYVKYLIDRKANESRLAPLWAAVLTHSDEMPIPEGVFTNMGLYTGEYVTRDGEVINPMLTWNGAYFQGMLPSVWFDEKSMVPTPKMFDDMARVQVEYSAQFGIPFLSSSSTVDSRYSEYGVDGMAEAYQRGRRSFQEPVGTPHATALYAMKNRDHAVELLLDVEARYPQIVSPAGWFDAVNEKGEVADKIIGLDQGMFAASFFADTIRTDVENYIKQAHGEKAWQLVERLYSQFESNGTLIREEEA